jgi:hypothetical protein
VIQACLASGARVEHLSTPERLAECVTRVRREHPHWRAPTATKLAALIEFMTARKVLERVLSAVREEKSPGIPDLFLYRRNPARGVHGGRFVEVKRRVPRTGYTERVSNAQQREHALLRALKLRVDVVYLTER